jgi:hypothetical protein
MEKKELIKNYPNLHRQSISKSELLQGMLAYVKKLEQDKRKFDVWVDSLKQLQITEKDYQNGGVKAKVTDLFLSLDRHDKEVVFSVYKGGSQYAESGKIFVIQDKELEEKQTETLAGLSTQKSVGLDGLGSTNIPELLEKRDGITALKFEHKQLQKEYDELKKKYQDLENDFRKVKSIATQRKKQLANPTPTLQAIGNSLGSGLVHALSGFLPQMQEAMQGQQLAGTQQQDPYQEAFGQNYQAFVEVADYLSEHPNDLINIYNSIQNLPK